MGQENQNKLFREKPLETISTPESLEDYLHVTSPGIWLILTGIILLLIGVCTWSVLGRINITKDSAVEKVNGKCICYVPQDAMDALVQHNTVTVEGKDYKVIPTSVKSVEITEDSHVYIRYAADLKVGDHVYTIDLEENDLKDGLYPCKILTETIAPIQFILNN